MPLEKASLPSAGAAAIGFFSFFAGELIRTEAETLRVSTAFEIFSDSVLLITMSVAGNGEFGT